MTPLSSTAPLVRVYIAALCGRAIYVHGGLEGRAAHFGFEPFRKKGLAAKFWFAKPAHAELVALRCVEDFKAVGAMRPHGWVDLPPSEVIAKIKATAAMLGAKWQTQGDIERDALKVVAEIIASVEAARQTGGLKEVNAQYKQYRRAQAEKREPAMSYSAHLHNFTRLLVLRAALKTMV